MQKQRLNIFFLAYYQSSGSSHNVDNIAFLPWVKIRSPGSSVCKCLKKKKKNKKKKKKKTFGIHIFTTLFHWYVWYFMLSRLHHSCDVLFYFDRCVLWEKMNVDKNQATTQTCHFNVGNITTKLLPSLYIRNFKQDISYLWLIVT